MAQSEEEKLRQKIARFQSMASAMGVDPAQAKAFVAGMLPSGGGGGAGTTPKDVTPGEGFFGDDSQTERLMTAALFALRRDAKSGKRSFPEIVRLYGDTLPAWKIREEYDAVSPYGPAKESEEDVIKWTKGTSANGYGGL